MKEIHSVKAFFKARGEQGAVTDAPLQKSFADTLITMLNSIKNFGPADAAQIVDAMKGCPYGEEQIARIGGIIDNKIQQSGRAQPTASGTKQTLQHWWNYLTKSDWDVLRDKKVSLTRKMTTLAERAMTIGCVSPCQQTEKWSVAVLMFMHYDEPPDPAQLYAKLGDLKHVFAAEKKDLDAQGMVEGSSLRCRSRFTASSRLAGGCSASCSTGSSSGASGSLTTRTRASSCSTAPTARC